MPAPARALLPVPLRAREARRAQRPDLLHQYRLLSHPPAVAARAAPPTPRAPGGRGAQPRGPARARLHGGLRARPDEGVVRGPLPRLGDADEYRLLFEDQVGRLDGRADAHRRPPREPAPARARRRRPPQLSAHRTGAGPPPPAGPPGERAGTPALLPRRGGHGVGGPLPGARSAPRSSWCRSRSARWRPRSCGTRRSSSCCPRHSWGAARRSPATSASSPTPCARSRASPRSPSSSASSSTGRWARSRRPRCPSSSPLCSARWRRSWPLTRRRRVSFTPPPTRRLDGSSPTSRRAPPNSIAA